jgi:hypothetical protein
MELDLYRPLAACDAGQPFDGTLVIIDSWRRIRVEGLAGARAVGNAAGLSGRGRPNPTSQTQTHTEPPT